MLYLESEYRKDWEREKPQQGWWSLSSSQRYLREEENFYRNPKKTPALEAAVLALQNFLNRDKTQGTMSCEIISFDSIKNEPRGKKRMSTVSLPVSQEQSRQLSQPQNQQAQAYFPNEKDWALMLSWGASALKSGMLPSAIRSPEAAAIVALKGRELGLPFMVAVAHIHVINGKPSMSAEMMQTLARKNLPGLVINILESDSKVAKIEFIRPEKNSKPFISTFTIEDARTANLLGKDVWKQYPAAMLFSRAISAGLRKVCPEALMGVSYTPEELGASVDQEGNVIETTGRAVTQSAPTPQGVASTPMPTQKQIARLFAIGKSNGFSDEDLKKILQEKFQHGSTKDLTLDEYDQFCSYLEEGKKNPADETKEVESFDNFQAPQQSLEPGSDADEDPKPAPVAQTTKGKELPWTKHLPKEDERYVK